MSGVNVDSYHKYYAAIQFERAGLFALVQQTYGSMQALYPGCFVHITPSLYFPHVVYVDRHAEAQSFFADQESMMQFIQRKKHYRRSAYIRFIAQDFTDPLPLPEASFDLLISIFSGDGAYARKRYLKPGGLLLTNNRLPGMCNPAADAEFDLVSVIHFQQGKYHLIEGQSDTLITPQKTITRTSRNLRHRDGRLQYVETETYSILTKIAGSRKNSHRYHNGN